MSSWFAGSSSLATCSSELHLPHYHAHNLAMRLHCIYGHGLHNHHNTKNDTTLNIHFSITTETMSHNNASKPYLSFQTMEEMLLPKGCKDYEAVPLVVQMRATMGDCIEGNRGPQASRAIRFGIMLCFIYLLIYLGCFLALPKIIYLHIYPIFL